MNNPKTLEVWLQGAKVGSLALTPENLCAFEYDVDFLRSGQSISPFYLPLKAGVFVAKPQPFSGNFGVFSDSLPDGWGSLLLDRYLTEKGINPHQINVLQRLSLIGNSGRGALEYRPAETQDWENSATDLHKLATDAEKILNADYSGASVNLLYQYAGSSGGARPKVFVKMDDGEWLVKFRSSADPENVGEIEYHYSLLAKKCGIEMPETRLFEGKYFGVKRFDRVSTSLNDRISTSLNDQVEKIHTISSAGLLNADYRIPSLDYSVLLTACLKLTRNMEEVYKLFRLMVFNVLIKNRDDHAKNFSFVLQNDEWKLSPAYDLLPSTGFNGFHTTTVNGQGNPTEKDIFAVAENVGLDKRKVKEICNFAENLII
jgi:serine/threonine-protein kinase HipA